MRIGRANKSVIHKDQNNSTNEWSFPTIAKYIQDADTNGFFI